jgi:prophage antirepressor-like protein
VRAAAVLTVDISDLVRFFCLTTKGERTMSEQKFSVLQEFSFKEQQQPIRVMLDANGNPWFVVKDVVDVLGIVNSRQAIQGLDEDEKGVCKVYTLGGDQESNIINLSGLFKLIFRSNKPQANTFSKWVTVEVLPAIMKTGFYGMPLDMDVPEDYMEAVDLLVFLDKHEETVSNRASEIRSIKKKVFARVKQGARPYHLPLDMQMGLFQAVTA